MPTRTFLRGTWDPVVVTYETVHLTGRSMTRTTRIEATAGGPALPGLPAATYPISLYPNVAAGTDPADDPFDLLAGYHRGHLIARALGGPNSHYNLVPMPGALNLGAWSAFEQAVSLRKHQMGAAPRRIYLRVDAAYPGANSGDPSVPSALRGYAYELPRIHPPGVVAQRSTAIDNAILAPPAFPHLALQTGPHNCDMSSQPFQFTQAHTAVFQAIVAAYNARNAAGAMPTPGGGNIGGTPTGGRGDPPAGARLGPYAQLDVLEDATAGPALRVALNNAFAPQFPGGLNYTPQVKRNAQNFAIAFRTDQRRIIKLANQFMNAGRFGSDNDWYDQGRRLNMSEAEVDHIIPQTSVNSSNFYWNAEVVGAYFNKSVKRSRNEVLARQDFDASKREDHPRKRRPPVRYTPEEV